MIAIPPAILLLDVDGVLNADRPCWPDPDMRATVHAFGHDWLFRWSPTLIGELINLHYMELIEIRWCTTWCPQADKLQDLWRTPAFATCWTDESYGADAKARKLAAARAVLASGRRLIWADDDAIPRSKVRRSLGMTGDALYLTPNSWTGLSPAHVAQITKFALAPYRATEAVPT